MNKLILVSGGTKGIGRAVLYKFASHGFDIITCARNGDDLISLRKEMAQWFPEITCHTFQADLSQQEGRQTFINEVKKLCPTLDVLVNNTGTFVQGSVYNEPKGNLEMMIETNLYSAYQVSRAFLPEMMAAKKGSVFNICSTASIVPYVNGGSYCISKYALYGMSKVLREEMKPYNVKVTAVLPGATLTSSWEGAPYPKERFIMPADIADAIWSVYCLSPNTDVEEILIRPQLGDI